MQDRYDSSAAMEDAEIPSLEAISKIAEVQSIYGVADEALEALGQLLVRKWCLRRCAGATSVTPFACGSPEDEQLKERIASFLDPETQSSCFPFFLETMEQLRRRFRGLLLNWEAFLQLSEDLHDFGFAFHEVDDFLARGSSTRLGDARRDPIVILAEQQQPRAWQQFRHILEDRFSNNLVNPNSDLEAIAKGMLCKGGYLYRYDMDRELMDTGVIGLASVRRELFTLLRHIVMLKCLTGEYRSGTSEPRPTRSARKAAARTPWRRASRRPAR
eukprot:TRINITY_DN14426_c0_g1_i1.p1 TRINITY_DN14426_c0_g1~~TRINITY_DN14426_c0_g1_i1.p1  ORF type:complete len:273 (-),score=68.71 TRINITY_DN14426_c0_g1_i1:79-897(-)